MSDNNLSNNSRIFFFSTMKKGIGGGGGGVASRLLNANNRYKYIQTAYFVFKDVIVRSPSGEMINIEQENIGDIYNAVVSGFLLNKNDVLIFHDFQSFFFLFQVINNLDEYKTIVVYHGQGGLYYEYIAYGNNEDIEVKRFYEEITKAVLDKAVLLAFPSKGAKDAFYETQPDLKIREGIILHNGCSPFIEKSKCDFRLKEFINTIKKDDLAIFSTVATFNAAKAVEKLPLFFKNYLEVDRNFLWIVVGDGVKQEEFKKNCLGIEKNVIWIKDRITNNDVLELYEHTDFYIIAQKLSIFDFATIEAMHMGCIPILSKVGGNLEIIKEDCGYFLENDMNAEGFFTWKRTKNIQELKEKNRDIASRYFSEKAMLKGYIEAIERVNNIF